MFTTRTMRRQLRQRRENRQFNSALRNASPTMQQELMAAATRQFTR
jgi:hypothetical protein